MVAEVVGEGEEHDGGAFFLFFDSVAPAGC
jgi:hypothetical protein